MNLVERLRGYCGVAGMNTNLGMMTNEAADRIEALEKSVNTFRKEYSKQKRQKCALRVELQQQVDELEAALKEIIDTDYAEPVAPVAMKEIARAALQENE